MMRAQPPLFYNANWIHDEPATPPSLRTLEQAYASSTVIHGWNAYLLCSCHMLLKITAV